MENLVSTYAEKFKHTKRIRRRVISILAVLALIVSCGVFWELHSDGVAMANETFCGMEEHQHSEDCYETVLVCGKEESEGTTGHVHDESCYEDIPTLVCNLEESEDHTHTDACYETVRTLTCTLEESDGEAGHAHTDDCYEEVLTCEIPEHVHTAACLSDDTADVETSADWVATLPLDLKGIWADDVVSIAESQVGYTESEANFQLAEDEETRQGYTRYGAWYGNDYGDWDAMFVSFCLHYAGVPENRFPEASGAYAWITELKEKEQADQTGDLNLYADAADYIPVPGDLVFFDTDDDEKADHVGIIDKVETKETDVSDTEEAGTQEVLKELTVIEGDSNDAVEKNIYDYTSEDPEEIKAVESIQGYGILPEQTDDDAAAADESKVLDGEGDFLYEDDNLTMQIHVAGSIAIPDTDGDKDEDEEVSWDDISLEVSFLDEDSEAYAQLVSYAEESDGELSDLISLGICFYYAEEELDVSDCEITAEITPSEEIISEATEMEEDEDTNLAVTVSVVEIQGGDVQELDSATVTEDDEIPTMEVPMVTEEDYGIMLLDDADPQFTVQFYANIEQILTQSKSGDEELTVIETSGGKLPVNGTDPSTSVVELKSPNNDDYYILDSETVLTEMYKAESYEFILEPDLHSMNKLEVNSDYTLKEILVVDSTDADQVGKTYSVTSTKDSVTGEYSYNISFTNNEAEADDDTIYISDGSVFRFIYDPTPSDAYVTVNMYDYNIGDGNVYAGASTSDALWNGEAEKYLYTPAQGINNSSNYSSSGAMLAFGNENALTGMDLEEWSNNGTNTFNKSNNNGFSGCTFSIVTGLDENGHIKYNSGIVAPNLFNDGDATGKQTYSNAQLTFDREGDTYTLTAISGESGSISADNLDTFLYLGDNWNRTSKIFSNEFWPLDGVVETIPGQSTGQDYLFGDSATNADQHCFNGSRTSILPVSDDGEDHNSYFGMNFDIEFSYTKDYVGPLEYFFFGDDDMWVFLDDTLVLDIGGVHSSVGEHVDLWDYLSDERDSMGEDETKYHTLSVFYTERGASGSTCYINYTLPTVSSVTPVSDSGSLRIDKQVTGNAVEEGKGFTFTIDLKDENGNTLTNLYNAIVYTDNEENEVENSYLVTSGDKLTLEDGWHFVVHNLPVGTVVTITETAEDGYSTTWQIVSPQTGDVHGGNVASGDEITITDGGVVEILFVNTTSAELPYTGGSGTIPFTVAGITIISTAAYFLLRDRRRNLENLS